jgi:hypothetical protein
MGRSIIQYGDLYQEYTSVCDAPTTEAMTALELAEYVARRYGTEGLEGLPARLERCAKYGSSSYDGGKDLEEFLICNRAGWNERHLSFEHYIQVYFIERREPREDDPWTPFDWEEN